MLITESLLVEAVGCTKKRAREFSQPITETCTTFEITAPVRLAAFLAQVGHESGSLQWVRELWGPTPAQQRYEGRIDLGNTQPGDGSRYRGRGLIQVTGRSNYARCRAGLRALFGEHAPDFEADPEALSRPRWAALSAGDFWHRNRCNVHADSGDFVKLTKVINGGENGLADRIARWERAKLAISRA